MSRREVLAPLLEMPLPPSWRKPPPSTSIVTSALPVVLSVMPLALPGPKSVPVIAKLDSVPALGVMRS